MDHIDNILKKYKSNGKTVNSIEKDISTVNSSTVNSVPIWEEVDNILKDRGITPEGVALHIAEELDDVKSLKLHKLLVTEHNHGKLMEAMHITKEAWRDGKIRTTKPIYYLAILNRWGFKTRFKETTRQEKES